MEASSILFSFNVFGYTVKITEHSAEIIIIQWILMAILVALSLFLTKNLKTIPDKKQNVVEIFVDAINKLIKDNMGESYMGFVPFIGTLIIFILSMNLVGLLGFESPTADLNVTAGLAIMSFVVIQAYAIKKRGLIHYFGGYFKPLIPIAPLNIIERIVFPVSLSLRLYGNMIAGASIIGLIYKGLGGIGWVAQIGLPVLAHGYFDLFDGIIQTFIFVMLTMVNIKIIAEE